MGAIMASPMKNVMEENMKKNQEFMLKTQKLQMGRQMAMQQIIQQKMMAAQIARQREMFNWLTAFHGTVFLGLFAGFMRTKKPALLVPVVPLSFLLAYQYDVSYGTKLQRIRAEAEDILNNETSLVALPNGPITFEDVERFTSK